MNKTEHSSQSISFQLIDRQFVNSMLGIATGAVLFLGAQMGTALAGETIAETFTEGTPYADIRYRYEFVDQAARAEDAKASTLRTRLGYKTGNFHDVSALLEFEDVTQIGSDNYNDTLNGKTDRPVVADIESAQVNQAFLQYTGLPASTIKVGRQVIALSNQRFVGHVGWRQNNQTFDAFTVTNKSLPDTDITYSYVDRVNRIFGEDSPAGDFNSDSHFITVQNTSLPIGKITAYAYLLDFDDAAAFSSKTFGASVNGKLPLSEDVTFKYHAEFATQDDYADNAASYDANYYHIAPSLSFKSLSITAGYEVLESDNGTTAFQTPLATLHKFNGFSDQFLVTPATGLEDLYLDVTYKVKGLEGDMAVLNGLLLKAKFHTFDAEDGGADYGDEIDLFAKYAFTKNYYVEAKYSYYDADDRGSDTEKLTLGLGAKF